jgi:4-amino-4-deoxy-L-arabinose transferase-like glycosyltransferase
MVKILIILLVLYAIASFLGLDQFPFVHSDETWLSSLSNEMLTSNTIKTTEPSFDLYPRHPHAIKLLFNLVQILFIKIFGFSILTIRSISLLFAIISALFFTFIVSKLTESRLIVFSVLISLLINIQFIYMSHFARQEALLIFFLMINLYYLHRKNVSSPVVSGIISGMAIGIHPNSFIIFLPILTFWLLTRRWKDLIKYISTVTAFAIFFVSISYLLDPHFIHNYLSYGDELGVNATLWDKVYQIRYFYLKLYYGVSGTYYTPDIRLYFYISSISLLSGIILSIRKQISPKYILMLGSINIGYILIGRYNQTSIIFSLPILLLIIAQLLNAMKVHYQKVLIAILILLCSINTYSNLSEHPHTESYRNYLAHIQAFVPDDTIVLGNLNTLMAFETAQVYDYRNLGYLESSVTDYIVDRNIEYILYPEEMDFIYEHRPLWNNLYGNLFPYYDELREFLEEDCQLIGEFESPIYAMRIVRYIESQPFTMRVYKVK